MIGKTLSRRRASSVSSARIEPLEPRRLLAAAMDSPAQFLGEVSAGYHRQIMQNVPARRTDSWGFDITQPVAVTLLADRLKHDGDLILQQTNSKGRVRTVARSNNPGRSAERIELTLEPGRYNIILSNQANKTNSYRLTARTAEVAAPSRVEATVWSGTSAHVRWLDNSHNETGFRVQQWIRGRWKNVAEANRNATAAVVSGHLQPGHEPLFRVVARRGQAAIASTNTMSVTMTGSDESGWYRVTGLTYKGVGEAGWDDKGQTLEIRPEFLAPKADPDDPDQSIWVEAPDWKMAVWTVVQGQLNVEATFDAGWIKKDEIVTHKFPSGGDFVVGTEAEIRQIGLNSTRKASYFKDEPGNKVIAVEDAYAELDRDYDDWWWEVGVERAAEVTLEVVDGTADENVPGDVLVFKVARTGNMLPSISVQVAYGGSAVAGVDYTGHVATISIPSGQGAAFITLTPIDDLDSEGDESVIVTLPVPHASAPYVLAAGGTTTQPATTQGVIRDAVSIIFESPPQAVGHPWKLADLQGMEGEVHFSGDVEEAVENGQRKLRINLQSAILIDNNTLDKQGTYGHEQRHVRNVVNHIAQLVQELDGQDVTPAQVKDRIAIIVDLDAQHKLEVEPERFEKYAPLDGIFPLPSP